MNYIAFNEIIGNEYTKLELKKILNEKKIPHSWLISGPEGIGKTSLLYAFIKELLSDIEGAFEKIQHKTFTDFFEITPEVGKEITVSEIKDIGKFLSLTSGESRYRIVLINKAENMNHHASNALLKILEEPPSHSIIFLISHNPFMLLPTIRSRCINMKMAPLSYEESLSVLNISDDEDGDKLISMSNGCPGVAKTLLENNANELYDNFLTIIASDNSEKIFEYLDNKDQNHTKYYVMNMVLLYMVSNIIKFITSDNFRANLLPKDSLYLGKISATKNLHKWFDVLDKINLIIFESNLLNFDRKHVFIVIFNLLKQKDE